MKFNELPVGCTAKFHGVEFVKIKDADTHKVPCEQYPDAVDLDNGHYIVISAVADCTLLKDPSDYPPRNLFYDYGL